jgi:SSS family solute:Na+ symporter
MLNFSLDNRDLALPAMFTGFLPIGLKGLAISGLLAALMSSLSSAFNSSSTLITFDFYKQYKPEATEKELVWVGQLATLVLVILSFLWIPFMKTLMSGGIFHYLQSVQAYISPPIAAVFLFGLLFKWINSKGAIIALWSGFALGMFRLVTEYLSKEGIIMLEQGSAIQIMLDINFLHYAIILFVFSVAVLMIFSKLGTPKRADLLELVTFSKEELNFKITWSTDAVLTVILIACVLTLWIIFSPIGIIS